MAARRGVSRLSIPLHAGAGARRTGRKRARYIRQVEEKCLSLGLGQVVVPSSDATVAMDREENWTGSKNLRMLVYGEGTRISGEE
jgi:hypothetical protein